MRRHQFLDLLLATLCLAGVLTSLALWEVLRTEDPEPAYTAAFSQESKFDSVGTKPFVSRTYYSEGSFEGRRSLSDVAFATGILFTTLLVLSLYITRRSNARKRELDRTSEEKRLQESELLYRQNRMRAIIDTAPDGIIVTAEDGTISVLNAAAAKIFGFEIDELEGANVDRILSLEERYRPNVSRPNAAFRSSEAIFEKREIRGFRKDGSATSLEGSLSRSIRGGDVWDTLILRDISERKLREEGQVRIINALRRSQEASINVMEDLARERREFQRANERLESEIAERKAAQERTRKVNDELESRNAELREARARALAASRAKSTFLANMTHEIRTPLTAIIGFTESALRLHLSPEEQHKILGAALRNGQHLLRLIDDILDLSKIEAGRLSVERLSCSPFDLLGELETGMRFKCLEKGLRLQFEYQFPLPLKVQTDPTRLKQVLYNLIGNAIKFTRSGSVTLRVRCRASAEELCFEVVDTGIGMSAQTQSKLFHAFSQGDASTTRQFGGTGLGLVIARQLIEKLGGQIHVQSQEKVGTTFSFTIATGALAPLDFTNSLPPTRRHQEDYGNALAPPALRGNVLVVDDATDNQALLKLLLTEAGAAVAIASNGTEAVQRALHEPFDLILMDMHMPVMDGYEAVMILRDKGYTKPILAVTASAIDAAADRCLEIGCDGYVRKPFEQSNFFATVAKYLGGATVDAEKIENTVLAKLPSLGPVVLSFVNNLPQRVALIRQAFAGEDFLELREAAHILCGAANFGYPTLGSAARELEGAAVNEERANIEGLIEKLSGIVEKIIAHKHDLNEYAKSNISRRRRRVPRRKKYITSTNKNRERNYD